MSFSFADTLKSHGFKTEHKTFEAFAGSFVPKNQNVNWKSNDANIIFKKHAGLWNWAVAKQTDKQEASLVQSLDLQTQDFKTRRDAIQYAKVVFPWLDLSGVKRVTGLLYENSDNLSIIQCGSGNKSWMAYNQDSKLVKNPEGIVISQPTRLQLLKALWKRREQVFSVAN